MSQINYSLKLEKMYITKEEIISLLPKIEKEKIYEYFRFENIYEFAEEMAELNPSQVNQILAHH